MPPQIDYSKCKEGCRVCYEVCPCDVFAVEGEKVVVRYYDECWHCCCCEVECPQGAIKVKLHHTMLCARAHK